MHHQRSQYKLNAISTLQNRKDQLPSFWQPYLTYDPPTRGYNSPCAFAMRSDKPGSIITSSLTSGLGDARASKDFLNTEPLAIVLTSTRDDVTLTEISETSSPIRNPGNQSKSLERSVAPASLSSPLKSTCEKDTQTDTTIAFVMNPRHIPTLENLFSKKGDLVWPIEAVTGFMFGSYTVLRVISQIGAHGLVVSCVDSQNRIYAMKIERQKEDMETDSKSFMTISAKLKDEHDIRVPRFIEGFEINSRQIVVMEKLGPSLALLQAARGHKPFSVKTVLQIARSLITAYEQIHNAGWLHLTAKQVNYCIGGNPETKHKIYAIDFGRAQRYMVGDANRMTTHRGRGRIEAPQCTLYQSLWGELRLTVSRRDDIMSLSLVLLHLTMVKAPWQKKGDWWRDQAWIPDFIEFGEPEMVKPLDQMLIHASRLKYMERPDYDKLRKSITDYADEKGIELDQKYDWDDLITIDERETVVLKDLPDRNPEETYANSCASDDGVNSDFDVSTSSSSEPETSNEDKAKDEVDNASSGDEKVQKGRNHRGPGSVESEKRCIFFQTLLDLP